MWWLLRIDLCEQCPGLRCVSGLDGRASRLVCLIHVKDRFMWLALRIGIRNDSCGSALTIVPPDWHWRLLYVIAFDNCLAWLLSMVSLRNWFEFQKTNNRVAQTEIPKRRKWINEWQITNYRVSGREYRDMIRLDYTILQIHESKSVNNIKFIGIIIKLLKIVLTITRGS
jgi:hypothetical protein